MPAAIPYIRFSSFKQSEGNSYDRQKKAVQAWLSANPQYTLSSLIFEDLGKSGFSTKASKKASGLIKIRQAIEAGSIIAGDKVLIEAFDRATRQQALDAIELITPILKAGVSIITLDDRIEYTQQSLNGSHFYLLVAKIQAAYGYSKILSDRVKESYIDREKKAREGEQVKRNTPAWLSSAGAVIPHIASKVVEVFDLYISGIGKHSIAVRMRQCVDENGVLIFPTCSAPTIDSWLTNKTVIGYWKDIPDSYPAIIEPEKFYLVQKLLGERKTIRRRTPKNFLVGLIRCAVCGGTMIIHNVSGKPNAFRCLSHHRHKETGCSNNKSIPYNVIQYLYLITAHDALKRALQKQTLTYAEKQKILLTQEIETISSSINKLISLVLSGDVPEVTQKISELTERRAQIQVELDSIVAGAVVDSERQAVIVEEQRLMTNDSQALNAMLREAEYYLSVDSGGVVTCSEYAEKSKYWHYLGVKRMPKSNSTAWFRLQYIKTEGNWDVVLKINSEAGIDISTFPLADTENNFTKPIQGRTANILIGVENQEQYYEQGDVSRAKYVRRLVRDSKEDIGFIAL